MQVRVGDLLIKEALITTQQLQDAFTHQRVNGGRLGHALVKLGFVKDIEITELLSKQFRIPFINLSQFDIDEGVIRLISREAARKYHVIPLSLIGATLTIAMTDPMNVYAMDDIKFMTGYNVEPVVASAVAATMQFRSTTKTVTRVRRRDRARCRSRHATLPTCPRSEGTTSRSLRTWIRLRPVDLQQPSGEAPVVRLVNLLLPSAVRRDASDVYIEPYENELRVRFRVDGVLYNVMTPPVTLREAVTFRLKIMAKLDIAEKRLPQDGRFKMRFRDRGATKEIDLRVSSLPTLFGERVVLRLLDRDRLTLDMTKLGFEAESLRRFEAGIRHPWGMVLVTGPTGSGKTNTLYSSISRINTPATNILTAEDPVEFNLTGVNQVQIRESIGLTFATALRSFLRQDPNVILVGEIRDLETAEVAVKAALTGHLVLSTLHTNDIPSSVARLLNMGVEPFLVASSLNLICAHRLVRCICTSCAEPVSIPPEALLDIGFPKDAVGRVTSKAGRGCGRCTTILGTRVESGCSR